MPFPQKSGLFMGRLPSMVFPRKGQTVKFIKYFGKGNTVNKTVLLKKGENTVELVRKIEYLFFKDSSSLSSVSIMLNFVNALKVLFSYFFGQIF
jgi:hypothetical protein